MAKRGYNLRLEPDLLKSMKRLHKALRPELSFNMYIEMKIEEKMIEEQERLMEKIRKQRDDPGFLQV